MRVLYLTFTPFQTSRVSTTVPTEGWFRYLRPRGLQPVLVTNQIGSFHTWAAGEGVPTYEVPLPRPNKWWPWRFFWALWRLRRLVQRHDIQLIHCNEQDIYPISQYLSRWCRLPVMVSVHFTMLRGYCEWAFGGKRQPRRISFLSRGSQEECRPGVEGIIPESAWRLLPNGLDLEHFQPDDAKRAEFRKQHGLSTELIIGVACAIRPRKQLEHLFEAVARLANPSVRVVLAGGSVPGDEAYAERLLRDTRAQLGDRFVHVGHLTELRDFYNALDLFVNTSQEEACSISVLEALACGTPVVGYPSKSVDEQVLPGGGEIVEQDRIDLLTASLDRWLSDPARLAEGRKGARRRAEQAFDIRKLANQLWTEYESILNGDGRERV
jgi:glycosyltransferase involved in cell wall biosynthesis